MLAGSLLLVGILAVAGCSRQPAPGKPYFGLASHYGPEWDGRRTASGETFRNSELTAAHKTLPFDSKVRVTLLSTQKSVVVRINDRGPYVKGREIDLSDEAARRIGLDRHGVAEVLIEVLEKGKGGYISPAKRKAAAQKKKKEKGKKQPGQAASTPDPDPKSLESLI
jgi:rare lipoprotein A